MAGYQSPTRGYPLSKETPYGPFLQVQLGAAARVLTNGICGELTAQIIERFACSVLDHQPYAVSILGGTNDSAGACLPSPFSRTWFRCMTRHSTPASGAWP
jgi:hypothetical protein